MPRCAQAAAVRDAQGMLPLELAVRHKAPAAVVEALKQAHVSISALLKIGASDAEVLEAHPEVVSVAVCGCGCVCV